MRNLTTRQVAEILQVTRGRVRQYVCRGQLQAGRFNHDLEFSPEDVEKFRQKLAQHPLANCHVATIYGDSDDPG